MRRRVATGGRATRATASGRSAATLERSTVGFGSDDDDALTRRRSGESRDDGGRAARWAAARAGDGRGGDTDDEATATKGRRQRLRRHDAAVTRTTMWRGGVGVATTADAVETTTRSGRDDAAGPTRRASVAPEPRYPKCSPKSALPQVLPQMLR